MSQFSVGGSAWSTIPELLLKRRDHGAAEIMWRSRPPSVYALAAPESM